VRDARRHRLVGLRARIVVTFGFAGLTLTVLLSMLTFHLARQFLVAQREELVTRQAFVNARLANDSINAGDIDASRVLGQLPQEPGARVLLRVSGIWYASTVGAGPDALPVSVRDSVELGNAARQRVRLDGVTQVVVGTPLTPSGALYFESFSMEELDDTLRLLTTALLVASIVTTALGAAAGWYASRLVLSPLQHVSRASSHIASGALDTRLRADGDPDLEPLVESFNAMADALQTRIEREARFSSDVSHELRTPLTALATAVQVLRSRERDLPERTRGALDVLDNQLRYFERLVLDLLEISRFDAGANTLALEPVDLESFVRDTVGALSDAPVRVAHAPERPVQIDKRRVERILVNLVENAAMHAGGVREVVLDAAPETVEIAVVDEGPGVRDADRPLLFDRFWRGSNTRHSGSRGTGLGLALVAEHARLHGGTVRVEPTEPHGATFVVRLPVGAAS
jgi:two-component system sensor histidine kinase MtrB